MPYIEPDTFIKRGWKPYWTGFPADLFFSGDNAAEPWTVKPHLHLNYAMGGQLSSLTFKDGAAQNHQIYLNGAKFQNPVGIPSQKIIEEMEFISLLT